ncbi:MAG: ComF family protein [Candidatus Omnitrophica bacterium]|nr:ComF family protein [Candidatus Omnitrophota bacterium]
MYPHAILTNLLYPPACLLCRTPLPDSTRPLCGGCEQACPRNGPPVCAACGKELPGAFDALLWCRACRNSPPAYEMARAPWRYAGCAAEAVQQFKYHHRWRIGRRLVEEMAAAAHASLPLDDIDAVVPVPLHWLKRRLRGFDPVEQLAGGLARSLCRPCLPRALRRIRWTATQTRLQGRARRRNVRGAFAANPQAVRGRCLLLVDDVLTSGATAQACAEALRRAGALRVFVLTAARTSLS